MSDEPTRDIAEEYATRPTIQTVVEMLAEFRAAVEQRFDAVDRRFDEVDRRFEAVDQRFGALDVRFDRVEALASTTRGEMLNLCADFNGLKSALKEHLPAPK